MKKTLLLLFLLFFMAVFSAKPTVAKITPTASPSAALEPTPSETPTPTAVPRADLTQKSEETVEPLRRILNDQKLGSLWQGNFIKYAIRGAVSAGVPPNTIVLLLLIPGVALMIAAIRQLVGLRGFGIFLPAALSVVFVAVGPVVGIGLFLLIVAISTLTRIVLRRLKVKLLYLPRMALILWLVSMGVLGVLFLTPVVSYPGITNVSIFAVLIVALLTEDFIRVQLGKSAKTAIRLTSETIILAYLTYIFLTLRGVQEFALLKPEIYLSLVLIFDLLLGKYSGLRLIEIWRFRKLMKG
jgi:hypothetical protein